MMGENKLETDQVEAGQADTKQADAEQVDAEQTDHQATQEKKRQEKQKALTVEDKEAVDLFAVDEDWPTLSFTDPEETSLIISADDHETRIAYLHEHVPTELFFDRSQDLTLVGNIYKGRVVRVLPGMQAAFVDIGLKQARPHRKNIVPGLFFHQ